MKINKIRHRGLKRFIEKNHAKDLPAANVEKIRDIITALLVADNTGDVPTFPGWKFHKLTGDRKGQWSITVSDNGRITFEAQKNEIHDLNFEGYH